MHQFSLQNQSADWLITARRFAEKFAYYPSGDQIRGCQIVAKLTPFEVAGHSLDQALLKVYSDGSVIVYQVEAAGLPLLAEFPEKVDY
jgi:hypothetical protein